MVRLQTDSERTSEDLRKDLDESRQEISFLKKDIDILTQKNQDLMLQLDAQTRRHKDLEKRLSINSLTGMPTHYRMNMELVELVERYKKGGKPFCLAIFHLSNHFDIIKKTLKTSVSEWVLYQVANRIQDSLDQGDRVFHTRDNEFVLVLFGKQGSELKRFLALLQRKVHEPHIFSGFNLTVMSHLGAALFPNHGNDKSQILHHADLALGAAMERNKDFIFYHDDLREQVVEKMELQNSIIKAIEAPALEKIGHQFEIFFQPKVEVQGVTQDSLRLGKIGAEALIRWNHPEKGQLAPAQFIPLAEETGLIMPIGKWVLYQVVSILKKWQGTALSDTQISLNLSPRQFKSDDMVTVLRSILDKQEINPENIVLELTETSVFEDPMSALEIMQSLRELGVSLSVDDFGTGYSSLSYLHRFPLDEIKIDKSFLDHFPDDHHEQAIISSLVGLAMEMDLRIVAEGVERMDQIRVLHEMGCNTIQGYFFAKPMPLASFSAWAEEVIKNNRVVPVIDEEISFS
jgi:diguanylate cyclase (GGDEF)-like protein